MAYDFSSGTGEEEVTDLRLTRLAHSLAHTNVEQSDDCCYDDYWEEPTLHLHINHVEVNVDEEDGWISDPELCAPVQLPPEGSRPKSRKSYMDFEDDVWVDEAEGTFQTYKTSDPSKVTELLRDMFNTHGDVYSLLLAFLDRAGRVRMQKDSLPRMLLTEFKTWLGEHEEKPKSAVLTSLHRKEALQILTRCHSTLMDDMTDVFDLHAADKTAQLDVIDCHLAEQRLKEAVTYTWKFGLQEYFDMSNILLPLVALDKINLIEGYIEESKTLQEEFVSLLDDLCEPGTTQTKINRFVSSCSLIPKDSMDELLSKSNCKLNFKQLYRLAHRMVTKYNLDLSKFSHIHSRWSTASLHHLLQKRYIEGAITEGNINDLLESVVEDNTALQFQLVKELVYHNDIAAAVYWAGRCELPVQQLPFSVQIQLEAAQSSSGKKKRQKSRTVKLDATHDTRFFKLSLPLSNVVFVDEWAEFEQCWDAIKQPNTVIGIDAEWKLPYCNRGVERLAVLQLAVEEAVYLLDMVHLPRAVGVDALTQFISCLFHSEQTLKLGYGIRGDLHMLSKSWPFTRAIVSSPVRVLDLQQMEKMVEELKKPSPTPSPCTHSHLKTTPTTQSQLPLHPLLTQNRLTKTISPPKGVWSRDEGSERTGGLALLVEKCVGKPLDKSQQLSDWEKRPLTPEQITYAALDAHCLLSVYKYLMAEAMTYDLSFNIQPALVT